MSPKIREIMIFVSSDLPMIGLEYEQFGKLRKIIPKYQFAYLLKKRKTMNFKTVSDKTSHRRKFFKCSQLL